MFAAAEVLRQVLQGDSFLRVAFVAKTGQYPLKQLVGNGVQPEITKIETAYVHRVGEPGTA